MDKEESIVPERERIAALFDASLRDHIARYHEVYEDIDNDTLLLIRKIGIKILGYKGTELKEIAKILDTDEGAAPDDSLYLGLGKDETDRLLGRDERQTFAHAPLSRMYQIDIETEGEELASSFLRNNVALRLFRLTFLREPYQEGKYNEIRMKPHYQESLGLLRSTINNTYNVMHPSQPPPAQTSE